MERIGYTEGELLIGKGNTMELFFNKNNWIKVEQDTPSTYKVLKCSDRILSDGSPYKDRGFAIIYDSLDLETAEEYAKDEYEHMISKIN